MSTPPPTPPYGGTPPPPGGYPPPPGGYTPGGYPPYSAPPPRRSGLVKQVPVVAIIMIVQGSLECLIGLILLIAGPAMLAINPRGSDREVAQVLGPVYVVLGLLILALGALRIIAGIKNLKYRGRTFGILALSIGALTMFTCYCAPTSIGLLIYGLIVYLNADVRQAFDMGEQGATPDQIKASFG